MGNHEEYSKKGESSDNIAAKPLILNFQPTSFRVLKEAKELKQWEQNLISRVGLSKSLGFADSFKRIGTCCDSSCPSIPVSGDNMDVDDCDMD